MEGNLILPPDIRFIPAMELSEEIRRKIGAGDGDLTVTRPHSRAPSKVVDPETYALLKEFEKPNTIVQAVLRFSKQRKLRAEQVLDDAFPLLRSFFESKLLVDPDSVEAQRVEAAHSVGQQVAGVFVEEVLAVISDTELYRGRTSDGEAVLKIGRTADPSIRYLLKREAGILEHGQATGVLPALLDRGELDGKAFLVMEYCPGIDAASAAAEARGQGAATAWDLCGRILEAYSRLHGANIVHGDVHPRNIQVDGDIVRLLDFGVSVVEDESGEKGHAPRAGIGYFFEPEYARAVLANAAPPKATKASDQYALGALCYLLISGEHYLDFPGEKREMMRAIAEDPPVPFAMRGASVPDAVERAVFRALEKNPAHRFASTGEFAAAFRGAIQGSAKMPRGQAPQALIAAKLDEVLRELDQPRTTFEYRGPRSPSVSVTYGAAGIAYMLYRLACVRGGAGLLSLADQWAITAAAHAADADAFYHPDVKISPETVGRASPYHTASGVHAVQALIAAAMDDHLSLGVSIEAYLAASSEPCDKLDLTLGHFSTVIGLTMLMDVVPDGEGKHLLSKEGSRRFAEAWAQVERMGPIATCRQEPYLGIAHGWAGFLYTALRWASAKGCRPPEDVESRLHELAALGEPHRKGMRWPFHLEARGAARHMGGWCNGTAGFLQLWTLAHRVYRQEWLLRLAEQSAEECAAAPGGVASLCCGAAGQGYALLALHNHTGEQRWLDAARGKAIEGVQASSRSRGEELPFSLYKGDVGLALLCAEIEAPSLAAMPFF
ncbi:MAG: protein kinase [Bryobacterales bacterium]|nr:protein kinase [Bryobacterales bacterium]